MWQIRIRRLLIIMALSAAWLAVAREDDWVAAPLAAFGWACCLAFLLQGGSDRRMDLLGAVLVALVYWFAQTDVWGCWRSPWRSLALAVSPDGSRVLVNVRMGGWSIEKYPYWEIRDVRQRVHLLNSRHGVRLATLFDRLYLGTYLANRSDYAGFSGDGRRMGTLAADGRVKLWDVEKGREVQENRSAYAFAFANHKQKFASWNGIFELGDLEHRTLCQLQLDVFNRELSRAPQSRAEIFRFSPDDSHVAISGPDRVEIWSVDQEAWKIHNLERSANSRERASARALAFSPDGRMLALAEEYGCELWGGLDEYTILPASKHARDVAFSPDGRTLAVCRDESLDFWSLQESPSKPAVQVMKRCSAVAYSPDGKVVFGALFDGTVRAIDPKTGNVLWTTRVSGGLLASPWFPLAAMAVWAVIAYRTLRQSRPAEGSPGVPTESHGKDLSDGK